MTAATLPVTEVDVARNFGELIKRASDAFSSDATYAAEIVSKARQVTDRKRRPRTAA